MVGLGGGFLMGHFGLGISETLESYGLVNELLESLESDNGMWQSQVGTS